MAAMEMGILATLGAAVEVFDAVRDERLVPGRLTFRNRINKVPALNGDIVARFLGEAHIADVVGYDQKASTYRAARIKFEESTIPKLKFGFDLTETDILRLEALSRYGAGGDSPMLAEFFRGQARTLIEGLEWQEENMCVGLEIDQFSYSRNGMIFTISWGMPSQLKVTAATAWTNAAGATPIADVLNLAYVRQVVWGRRTDRVKMSTPTLQLIPKTAEFQQQVRNFFLNLDQPTPAVPYQSDEAIANLVGRLLGMDIELYDQYYSSHPTDGSPPQYQPFLPLSKVILDSKQNDGNDAAKDFASGTIPETVIGKYTNTVFGRPPAGQGALGGGLRGPLSWVTVPWDLNPASMTWWAAEVGMPRKKDEALTAVIDVGPVTNPITIPTTIPF